MIFSWDRISPHEMFSNIYKIWEVAEGCVWRWRGRWSAGQRVTLMNHSLVEMLSLKAWKAKVLITHVAIVMSHHLQETTFMKEAYKKYIKDDMKSTKGKHEEQRPERVKPFIWQELQNKSSASLLTSKPISSWDLPGGPVVKNLPANARDAGSIPGPGRSHMPQLLSSSSRPCKLQLLKPEHLQPMLSNKRSHCNEKPAHHDEE